MRRFIHCFLLSVIAAMSVIVVTRPAASKATAPAMVDVHVALVDEPLAGAFVALTPADAATSGAYGDVTDVGGTAAFIGVSAGTYTVTASWPGATLGETLLVVGADISATLTLTRTGSRLRALGAYGAQVGTIVADGKSGVFYLNTTGVPSFYRTGDYGGHWAPVTLRIDDEARGLVGDSVGSPATSGHPGEIAAVAAGKVFYSRDFGNTWRSFTAPAIANPTLLWGHVGDHSVLLAVEAAPGTRLFYTVMPTSTLSAAPTGMTELTGANNFRLSGGDKLHLSNGSAAPILAVAAGTGSAVTLYELPVSGGAMPGRSSALSSTVSGFPAFAPTFVRLGGPAIGEALGSGATPDTLLVYSNDATPAATAVMAVHATGVWSATTAVEFRAQFGDGVDAGGSFNSGGSSCGGQPGSIGSLAPAQSGVGSVSQCWLVKSGATLIVRPVQGINNNTGFAFDAGYDGTTNAVIISGDGSKGAVKSALSDPFSNRPTFPGWPQLAASGTVSTSSGLALRGVRSPVVRDTVFGATANELITVFSFTGGGRVVASNDGGETFFDLPQKASFTCGMAGLNRAGCASRMGVNLPPVQTTQSGGMAVDWWIGASGTRWLLANAGGGGTTLWITATDTITPGAVLIDLLGSETLLPNVPVSLVGLHGQDMAYVGMGDRADNAGSYAAGGLYQAALTGTVLSYNGTYTAVAGITQGVPALEYCGVTGSAASISDTLIAAIAATSDNGTNGGIARFTTAATTPVSQSVSLAGANFREVRADCATGTVWAGAYVNSGIGLFKSTDGGATFVQQSAPTWVTGTVPSGSLNNNLRNIETLAISPDDAATLIVVTKDGDVIGTRDGGVTWGIINDATSPTGRRFGNERPGDIEIPPAPVSKRGPTRAAATLVEPTAVFGSSAGLFTAQVSWSSSVDQPPPPPVSYSVHLPLVRR